MKTTTYILCILSISLLWSAQNVAFAPAVRAWYSLWSSALLKLVIGQLIQPNNFHCPPPLQSTISHLSDHFSASPTPSRAAASTRVLEYYSSSKLLEYFLLLEYSLISISGCKFPFPVAVFLQCRLQSVDELLEFMETWGFAISFASCQPGSLCPHKIRR